MTAHTYAWFCSQGMDQSADYDWEFEDQLLAHVGR